MKHPNAPKRKKGQRPIKRGGAKPKPINPATKLPGRVR